MLRYIMFAVIDFLYVLLSYINLGCARFFYFVIRLDFINLNCVRLVFER
jgi:hypothetical protein